MICPRLHFKRINYCKDNFCQICKAVNLIPTKFLYFFDLPKCYCKIKLFKILFYLQFSKFNSRKILNIYDFSFAQLQNFITTKIHSHNPSNSFLQNSSHSPHFSPPPSPTLQTAQSKLLDSFPIFDFFVMIFFSSMHVIPFE